MQLGLAQVSAMELDAAIKYVGLQSLTTLDYVPLTPVHGLWDGRRTVFIFQLQTDSPK